MNSARIFDPTIHGKLVFSSRETHSGGGVLSEHCFSLPDCDATSIGGKPKTRIIRRWRRIGGGRPSMSFENTCAVIGEVCRILQSNGPQVIESRQRMSNQS